MADAVLDTNILIDYLLGIDTARETISRYMAPAISIVTWMEVLVGAADETEDTTVRRFLDRFEHIGLTGAIAERAIVLRRTRRIRLPDAVIWATAQEAGCSLVTRNVRHFPAGERDIVMPYAL